MVTDGVMMLNFEQRVWGCELCGHL